MSEVAGCPGGFGVTWHWIIALAVIGIGILWRRGWFDRG